MWKKLKTYIEPHPKVRLAEIIFLAALILISAVSFTMGFLKVNGSPGALEYTGTLEMTRDFEAEDYDEDSTVCDVIYVKDEETLLGMLRESGKRIAVTAVEGGIPYYEADLGNGTALIIGNEGNGVSASLLEGADVRVTIPMRGRIESLNAAVAAAILMYEAVRA